MEQTDEKKLAAGLSFMGRPLGELLELKASCRKRLEYLEANRGRISEYVYNKLRQEYIVYLDAVDGEVDLGLSEYEIKLAEIRLFANQLKLLEKSYREKLEELSLRHSLGEFDQERYEILCSEHEAKMKRFAGSLEKYQGQKKQIETFLAQARIERSLLDDDEPRMTARTEPEPAMKSDPDVAPDESAGPPKSTLLELGRSFSEQGEPDAVVVDSELQADAEQPIKAESIPVDSDDLEELPGLSSPPEESLNEEAGEQAILEEALPEAPSDPLQELAEEEPVADTDEPPVVDSFYDELPEAPAPLQDDVEPESVNAAVDSPDEELPETPVPDQGAEKADVLAESEPAEIKFLEDDLPEEPVKTASSSQPDDLAAMMGMTSGVEEKDSAEEFSLDNEAETEEQSGSGFDLEDIFGQSQPSAEVEQAGEELNWEETLQQQEPTSPEAAQVQPGPELTETPAQPVQEPAGATLEDSLLSDLTAPGQPESDQGEYDSDATKPDESGLDLDDILDQSGASGPAVKPQPESIPESQEPEPVQAPEEHQQVDQPLSELERDLDQEIERVSSETPVSEPVIEEAIEEPDPELPAAEIQPDAMQEQQQEPEPGETGGAASLVSMALQRASQEQGHDDEPVQEEVAEFNLGGEVGESDVEVQLTMNQTIDAIKKKTVKCPECGTMNYAIRWYCENCEATLTAL